MAHDDHAGRTAGSGSASSHRLPTVSASQALFLNKEEAPSPVLFGLDRLDRLLHGQREDSEAPKGIPRGRVTELYGPPGAGKTALCMQAAATALKAGHEVVWIDGAAKLALPRLRALLSSSSPSSSPNPTDLLTHLHHITTPTLAHLIALLFHPPPSFPPPSCTLLILESLSSLLESAYPRVFEDYSLRTSDKSKNDTQRWLAGRRVAVVAELAAKLSRFAAVRNVAVLVSTDMMTKVRRGEDALLMPVLAGKEWANAMGARVVLFADWPPRGSAGTKGLGERKVVRYAGLVKAVAGGTGEQGGVVPFVVEETGVRELAVEADAEVLSPEVRTALRDGNGKKRAHEEVADSDDSGSSEYGWAGDDAEDGLAAAGLVP